MFVIEIIYKASLAEIDAHMAAHVKFLKKYYAAGNFLVSGRKIPRDGGIIVAVGPSRERMQAIIEEDPFHARGLADFRIDPVPGEPARGRHSKTDRADAPLVPLEQPVLGLAMERPLRTLKRP